MNKFDGCGIGKASVLRQAVEQVLVALFSLVAFGGMAHGDVLLETGFEGSSNLPSGWTQNPVSGSATWKVQQGG